MRLLTLDAALGPASVAVVEGDAVVGVAGAADAKGLADLFIGLERDGHLSGLDGVAVTVGPGSFTGLRSALSLAGGYCAASGLALIPVTLAEAFAAALPNRGARSLWVAVDSRRDRLFLDRGDGMRAVALASIALPAGAIAVAGDAAREVAAALAARGADVMLTDARRPRPRDIALAARRRRSGELPPLPLVPLYVDPPAARLP
jgi:tRNA threonylcarbamoyl adenosine modification protein YeaZ